MNNFLVSFRIAVELVIELDPAVVEIVLLSLQVTFLAVVIASIIGFPLGAALAVFRFPGRSEYPRTMRHCGTAHNAGFSGTV